MAVPAWRTLARRCCLPGCSLGGPGCKPSVLCRRPTCSALTVADMNGPVSRRRDGSKTPATCVPVLCPDCLTGTVRQLLLAFARNHVRRRPAGFSSRNRSPPHFPSTTTRGTLQESGQGIVAFVAQNVQRWLENIPEMCWFVGMFLHAISASGTACQLPN